MKTLLITLITLIPYSTFSQIPQSGVKHELKLDIEQFYTNEVLPGSPYKVVKVPEKLVNPEVKGKSFFNYQMPIKKLNSDGYAMPFKETISFDEMNADFYFNPKRTTTEDR